MSSDQIKNRISLDIERQFLSFECIFVNKAVSTMRKYNKCHGSSRSRNKEPFYPKFPILQQVPMCSANFEQ